MKKVWNGFKTLVITILTVLVASNHTNFIYVGLERVGLADETIKKSDIRSSYHFCYNINRSFFIMFIQNFRKNVFSVFIENNYTSLNQ